MLLEHLDDHNQSSSTKKKQHQCLSRLWEILFMHESFKRHMRIHIGEKPYKCTDENCEKTFYRSDLLKRHKKTCN